MWVIPQARSEQMRQDPGWHSLAKPMPMAGKADLAVPAPRLVSRALGTCSVGRPGPSGIARVWLFNKSDVDAPVAPTSQTHRIAEVPCVRWCFLLPLL